MDLLELDLYTVGFRSGGLEVKHSHAKSGALGSIPGFMIADSDC